MTLLNSSIREGRRLLDLMHWERYLGYVANNREIFFDANASHPLLPSVREAYLEAMKVTCAAVSNPMSIHGRGRSAKRNLFELKESLCRYFGVKDVEDFVLNSGATEGINTVLRGFVKDRLVHQRKPVILCSSLEHSAVLETLEDLPVDFVILPVNKHGQLDETALFSSFERHLSDDSTDILLVLQLANNEVGTAFDFSFQLRLHERFGPKILNTHQQGKGGKYPQSPRRYWTLLDAAQAFGKMPESYVRRAMHFADYMVLSAHKIGGPTGIGALWLNGKVPFVTLLTGGAQEKKRRSGTHNTLGILGFKFAVLDWLQNAEVYRVKLNKLREQLFQELNKKIVGLHVHGLSPEGHLPPLCNTLNFSVDACPENALIVGLDLEKAFVSSGSACNSGAIKPSRILQALGLNEEASVASVRVSLPVESTECDVVEFVERLHRVVSRVRAAGVESERLLPEIKLSSQAEIG